MELPKETTKPKENISDYITLIYGAPKIGKTTFASQANKPIFCMTEPGLNAIEAYQVHIKSWEEFLEFGQAIQKGDHEFGTIVIDTIENLHSLCEAYICEQNDIQYPNDLPYGKGYAFVRQEFQSKINKLASMPYGLMMIAHSKNEKIENPKGRDYVKIMPSLPSKANDYVVGLADIILYCDTDSEDTRLAYTKPTLEFVAGDRTGRLPNEIPLDYNLFKSLFEKGTESNDEESKHSKDNDTA